MHHRVDVASLRGELARLRSQRGDPGHVVRDVVSTTSGHYTPTGSRVENTPVRVLVRYCVPSSRSVHLV